MDQITVRFALMLSSLTMCAHLYPASYLNNLKPVLHKMMVNCATFLRALVARRSQTVAYAALL